MDHLSGLQLLRNSLMKLFIECFGTLFLSLAFNGSLYKNVQVNGSYMPIPNWQQNQVTVLMTLWVLTIFAIKISGAHFNPAVSCAYMIRKDVGNFPRLLGFAYIVSQCFGAFFGALISYFLRVDNFQAGDVLVVNDDGANVFAAIVAETLGSFLVVFFFLTQTEPKTTISKEKSINCFIIASAYVSARSMLYGCAYTRSGACLNPAIALGSNFTQLFEDGGEGFKWVWIYCGFPIIGALIAVLFHEYVFKKTQEVLFEGEELEDAEDTLLDK